MENFTFTTIGTIESAARFRQDAPRQSAFAGNTAFLRWASPVYRAAAEDLTGFDYIWLIWVFDRNINHKWRSKVRVPVPAERDCYSVFATRSPYRPNPIGISAVKLEAITAEGLQLGPCDLLDGTAVLDVKPYIPQADAFPDARAGWRDRIDNNTFEVEFSPLAAEQADFILQQGNLDIANFCRVQLAHRPQDDTRKRLEFDAGKELYTLHYRTWKIIFACDTEHFQVYIHAVASNYSPAELQDLAHDKYCDKALHCSYKLRFDNKF